MSLSDSKTSKIISAAVMAVVLLFSGWAGISNYAAAGSVADTDDDSRTRQPVKQVSAADTVTATDIPDVPEEPEEPEEPVTETVVRKMVRVKKAVNIREKDNQTAEKVAILAVGTEVEYVSETDAYYQVKYAGSKLGWMLKTCGEVFEKTVTITHFTRYRSGDPISLNGSFEGSEIDAILKNYATTGASVAIIKDGKVAYHYEYGYANKENNVKVSQNTKFRIASISKVFTSMLAIAEVDDGKLDLDAPLTDLFGFRFYHPSYPKIPVTMRMLLTHTSGLTAKEGMYSKPLSSITCNKSYYSSRPGSSFIYSNLGMGVAGAVVEKAADQTISQYARDRFFADMGIDASYDAKYLSDPALVADCYAGGYVNCSNKYLTRNQEKGKPGDVFHLGQGGLLISSVDLARIFTLLLNDGQYEGKQYLSHKAVTDMLTPQDVNTKQGFEQCIGIRYYKQLVKGHDLYYHNGAFYGIYALLAIDTSDGSGVVIITSGAGSKRNSNTVFAVCDDILNYTYANILD